MSVHVVVVATSVTITCDKRSCDAGIRYTPVPAGSVLTHADVEGGRPTWSAEHDALLFARSAGWTEYRSGTRTRHFYCPTHQPAPGSTMKEVTR